MTPGQAAREPDPWRGDLKAEQAGQAAYEAKCASFAARHGRQPRAPWRSLPAAIRADWEAAASAAVMSTPLYAELARQLAALQADLAAAEAEFGKWPRCPGGCRCRVGTGDADALECGCDGPCTTGWERKAGACEDCTQGEDDQAEAGG